MNNSKRVAGSQGRAGVEPGKSNVSVIALPMHGNHKMLAEGYRTRDAHLIEWMGRLCQGEGLVEVVSRPEPIALRPLHMWKRKQALASNTLNHQAYVWRVPNLRLRRQWWIKSLECYPSLRGIPETPAVIWNPLVAISKISDEVFNGRRTTVVDLLDDWSIHYAFADIRRDVERAYGQIFSNASYVTANSEGTVELATRFGRDDVRLIANGVDPDRFTAESKAAGQLTVGYVGKIGNRVDLQLVQKVARALPYVDFVFAGPILDRDYRAPLSSLQNVKLLGDVQYMKVPDLLQTFDIGWVPHRVGEYEVGGDVIKTYEYRAAGLPVLSTPVIGAGDRGLEGVTVLDSSRHADWLRSLAEVSNRVGRLPESLPDEHSWKYKANAILELLSRG